MHNPFKSRDCNIEHYNPKEEITHADLKRKIQLGHKISATELGVVLEKMKNNKSPGIDVVSADYLKEIRGKLKFLLSIP